MKNNKITRRIIQEKTDQSEYKLDPRGISRKDQRLKQKATPNQEKSLISEKNRKS